jgi:hypothetical protein
MNNLFLEESLKAESLKAERLGGGLGGIEVLDVDLELLEREIREEFLEREELIVEDVFQGEELEEDLELRKPIDVFQENLQEGLGGYLIEEEVDDWVGLRGRSGERATTW